MIGNGYTFIIIKITSKIIIYSFSINIKNHNWPPNKHLNFKLSTNIHLNSMGVSAPNQLSRKVFVANITAFNQSTTKSLSLPLRLEAAKPSRAEPSRWHLAPASQWKPVIGRQLSVGPIQHGIKNLASDDVAFGYWVRPTVTSSDALRGSFRCGTHGHQGIS